MGLNYGPDLCMHCTCANWVLTLKKITIIKESSVFKKKSARLHVRDFSDWLCWISRSIFLKGQIIKQRIFKSSTQTETFAMWSLLLTFLLLINKLLLSIIMIFFLDVYGISSSHNIKESLTKGKSMSQKFRKSWITFVNSPVLKCPTLWHII